MRNIDDILKERTDISPFLVHLTKTRKGVYPPRKGVYPHSSVGDSNEWDDDDEWDDDRESEADMPARQVLRTIIEDQRLIPGDTLMSDAKYGINLREMSIRDRQRFFSAVSFTETPLGELHSLLEIAWRQINLEGYGLVFPKERLCTTGVMPVWYVNNDPGDKERVLHALCSLINTHAAEAEQILPLVAVFGRRLRPSGNARQTQRIDFSWEREWRWPSARGPFKFSTKDVFLGLCPHSEIDRFESLFPPISFIDPRRPLAQYNSKLRDATRRLKLKSHVLD